MPDTKRTAADILRDFQTFRSGAMPKGDHAPSQAKASAPDPDPVEEARMQMATRRNRGQLHDTNLPLSGAVPEAQARAKQGALYKKLGVR